MRRFVPLALVLAPLQPAPAAQPGQRDRVHPHFVDPLVDSIRVSRVR